MILKLNIFLRGTQIPSRIDLANWFGFQKSFGGGQMAKYKGTKNNTIHLDQCMFFLRIKNMA